MWQEFAVNSTKAEAFVHRWGFNDKTGSAPLQVPPGRRANTLTTHEQVAQQSSYLLERRSGWMWSSELFATSIHGGWNGLLRRRLTKWKQKESSLSIFGW